MRCLVIFFFFLKEDLIVVGRNFGIFCRFGKIEGKGSILVRVVLGKIIIGNLWKNIVF